MRGGVLVTPLAALACEQVRAGTRLFSLASVRSIRKFPRLTVSHVAGAGGRADTWLQVEPSRYRKTIRPSKTI